MAYAYLRERHTSIFSMRKELEHIAIVMDGNRRDAKQKGLATAEGHLAGAKRIEPLVARAGELGVPHLSFYAFSTENWGRPEDELKGIMGVFQTMLEGDTPQRMKENGVKMNILGDYASFPSNIVKGIEKIQKESEDNDRITVNFALGYGGRAEIVRAVNMLLSEGVTKVDEKLLSNKLYTAGQPDVDLFIRPGGEQRTSGFLLWQSPYAELYFTDILWPNFTPEELDKAVEWYKSRDRRFGK